MVNVLKKRRQLMKIKIAFDGAANNHLEDPPAGVGIYVEIDDISEEELSRAIYIAPNQLGLRNTNNTTEWQGCIEAMKTLIELSEFYPTAQFEVYSDSQVVTQVFNGNHKTHTPIFEIYNEIAHSLLKGKVIKIKWIPREENKHADKLSKIGINMVKESIS